MPVKFGGFGRTRSKFRGIQSLIGGIVLAVFGIIFAVVGKSFTPLIITALGIIGIIYGIYRISTSPNLI